jgi:hypothetical protein
MIQPFTDGREAPTITAPPPVSAALCHLAFSAGVTPDALRALERQVLDDAAWRTSQRRFEVGSAASLRPAMLRQALAGGEPAPSMGVSR